MSKSSKSKRPVLEIEQVLDIKDPMSQIILFLSALDILLLITSATPSTDLPDKLLFRIVEVLLILYVLSCYRNGKCHVLAMVLALLVTGTLTYDIAMRLRA